MVEKPMRCGTEALRKLDRRALEEILLIGFTVSLAGSLVSILSSAINSDSILLTATLGGILALPATAVSLVAVWAGASAYTWLHAQLRTRSK